MTKRKHKKPEIVEVPEPAYRQPEPDVIVVDRVEAGDRALETARIEVLRCKSCGRLSISVDSVRQDTKSHAAAGRGDGKCSGQWTVLVSAESAMNAQERELREALRELLKHIEWVRDHGKVRITQTRDSVELNAFNQGRVDGAESTITFFETTLNGVRLLAERGEGK